MIQDQTIINKRTGFKVVGFIQCQIIPPHGDYFQDMMIPFLQCRVPNEETEEMGEFQHSPNQKSHLASSCCFTCSKSGQVKVCTHSPKQRMIQVSASLDAINHALKGSFLNRL